MNEKFRENVPAWDGFVGGPEKFAAFFGAVLTLRGNAASWQTHERVTYMLFIIHCFQSLEQEAVRKQALQLVSLPLWHALSRGRLQVCVAHDLHTYVCSCNAAPPVHILAACTYTSRPCVWGHPR